MEENILAFGKKIKCKDKVYLNGLMEKYIKAHLMGIIVDLDN